MQKRGLLNLALIAVLLIVVGYFAARGERADTEVQAEGGATILPGLKEQLAEVSRVEVRKAGNEVIATLERRDAQWVVANRESYPADFSRVRDLLTALAEARTREQKTSNPEFFAQLGLRDITDPETEARLVEVQAGERSYALLIGKRAEGWKSSYARLPEDGAASWVLDREIELADKPSKWLDELLIDVDLERIQSVQHTAPDGSSLHVHRASAEQALFDVDGVPNGKMLKYPEIPEVVADVLDDLRLEDVQRGDTLPAGAQDVYRASFRTFDGLVVAAEVAEVDGQHYLRMTAAHEPADSAAEPAAEREAAAAADDSGATGSADAGNEPAASAGVAAPRDVAAEAAELQQRAQGWVFRIAEYRYRGFAKKLDELLKDQGDTGSQG